MYYLRSWERNSYLCWTARMKRSWCHHAMAKKQQLHFAPWIPHFCHSGWCNDPLCELWAARCKACRVRSLFKRLRRSEGVIKNSNLYHDDDLMCCSKLGTHVSTQIRSSAAAEAVWTTESTCGKRHKPWWWYTKEPVWSHKHIQTSLSGWFICGQMHLKYQKNDSIVHKKESN